MIVSSSSVFIISSFFVLCLVSQTCTNNVTLEDQYIAHFGNEPPEILQQWFPLRNVWLNKQVDHLKRLVTTCHKLAGKGSLDWEHLQVGMQVRNLTFTNTQYKSRMAEMVFFLEFYNDKLPKFFRITEGMRSDCVFYVVGDEFIRDFYLDQHVCGIPVWLMDVAPTEAPQTVNWRKYVYHV